MSQSGPLNENAISPSIATEYDCDVGIAIPAANILNVFSDEIVPSRDYFEKGIETFGSGNTITIVLKNRFTGGGSTSNAVTPTNVGSTFCSLSAPGTWTISSQVSAYAPVSQFGASFQMFASGLWDGVTARVIGTPTVFSNVDAALAGAYIVLTVIGGNTFQIECFGVAAQNIDWNGVSYFITAN